MSTKHGMNPPKAKVPPGAPQLLITIDANGNTMLQGPLDNFQLCDRLLDDAKRIVLQRYLHLQFVGTARITAPTNDEVNKLALVRPGNA